MHARRGLHAANGWAAYTLAGLLSAAAPALAQVGGALVQAEDELASINMIIGASFGGVPALTATAGPGLSLPTGAAGGDGFYYACLERQA